MNNAPFISIGDLATLALIRAAILKGLEERRRGIIPAALSQEDVVEPHRQVEGEGLLLKV